VWLSLGTTSVNLDYAKIEDRPFFGNNVVWEDILDARQDTTAIFGLPTVDFKMRPFGAPTGLVINGGFFNNINHYNMGHGNTIKNGVAIKVPAGYGAVFYRIDSFNDDLYGTSYSGFAGYLKDHVVVRNGTELIIPEYNQEIGTENPICRIISKRISFGSLHSQKKLNSFMSAFVNNINFELKYYGIDHYKITFILDNKYTLSYKYGDYRGDSAFYSDVNSAYYSIPTNTDDGWHLQYIPSGADFNEMVVHIEFARLKDINAPTSAICQTSISEFGFNVVNKDIKKKGIQ
jgi:hypothetical protein